MLICHRLLVWNVGRARWNLPGKGSIVYLQWTINSILLSGLRSSQIGNNLLNSFGLGHPSWKSILFSAELWNIWTTKVRILHLPARTELSNARFYPFSFSLPHYGEERREKKGMRTMSEISFSSFQCLCKCCLSEISVKYLVGFWQPPSPLPDRPFRKFSPSRSEFM